MSTLHKLFKLFRSDRRGAAMIEFAISMPLLFLIGVGSFAVGSHLDRYLQMKLLTRYAANMYSHSADFGQTGVKNLLLKTAAGINISADGGDAVIYLSQIRLAGAGANLDQPVISHRIRIGSASVAASRIGTPTAVAADGHVANYEDDAAARAVLPAGLTLSSGQVLYLAEFADKPTDIAFPGVIAPSLMYQRTFF